MLLLIMLTYRLWTPSLHWSEDSIGTISQFPRLPMTSLNDSLAIGIDSVALSALVASLVVVFVRRDCVKANVAMTVIAVSLAALFLCNQHRLQPWAYQGWLYAIVFAAASPRSARGLVVALTISIYAYSALGKFDQQFFKTVGPNLIGAVFGPVGGDGGQDAGHLVRLGQWAVVSLPVAELAIAISLAVGKTRRIGGIAAIAMHLSLVGILGPFGLGHSTGVLVWNLYLALQSWLLFVRRCEPHDCEATEDAVMGGRERQAAQAFVHAVIVLAVCLPMLERQPPGRVYGYWDHWLSWSLYSPHTSRVEVQVHESALESLPAVLSRYTEPGDENDGWVTIELDRWSLAELAVPVYPQARFQFGLAREIGLQLVTTNERGSRMSRPTAIRIKIRSVANRRTGKREEVWALGVDGIDQQRRHFWLLP